MPGLAPLLMRDTPSLRSRITGWPPAFRISTVPKSIRPPAVTIPVTQIAAAVKNSSFFPERTFPRHSSAAAISTRQAARSSRLPESVAANRRLPTHLTALTIHKSGQRSTHRARKTAAEGSTGDIDSTAIPKSMVNDSAHRISRLESRLSKGTMSKNRMFHGSVKSVAASVDDTVPAAYHRSFFRTDGRSCLIRRVKTSFSGAESRIRPRVAEKDNSSPTLRQEKGFHSSRSSSAAPKAVSESFSSLSQKAAAQKTSKTTARTTDGEKPATAAYATDTGTETSRPAFFPNRPIRMPARTDTCRPETAVMCLVPLTVSARSSSRENPLRSPLSRAASSAPSSPGSSFPACSVTVRERIRARRRSVMAPHG